MAGERTKLQVAHFKLSYSRAFFLRAYPQQTHEMLFDAHNHACRVLGGVPRRGINDNTRPVSVRVYPERDVVAAEGQIGCELARVFARSHERTSTTTVLEPV
jgi:transposase